VDCLESLIGLELCVCIIIKHNKWPPEVMTRGFNVDIGDRHGIFRSKTHNEVLELVALLNIIVRLGYRHEIGKFQSPLVIDHLIDLSHIDDHVLNQDQIINLVEFFFEAQLAVKPGVHRKAEVLHSKVTDGKDFTYLSNHILWNVKNELLLIVALEHLLHSLFDLAIVNLDKDTMALMVERLLDHKSIKGDNKIVHNLIVRCPNDSILS
jgi:hypothetical protein